MRQRSISLNAGETLQYPLGSLKQAKLYHK
jgi:hypothetical protein